MKNFKLLTIICLLGIQGALLFSGDQSVAAYTRMKVDARALAMGGAFTATTDGVEATYYNPAGLMYSDGIEVGSMFSTGLSSDRTYNFAGVTMRLKNKTRDAIGISWLSAKLDGIPRYSDDPYAPSSGKFSVGESSILLSYASFDKGVNSYWGATLKLFNSNIDNNTEVGLGIDFGVMMEPTKNMKIGIIARDIYSKIGSERISPSINFGLTATSFSKVLASVDAGYIFDGESFVQYSAGVEYHLNYQDNVSFIPRAGLNNDSITAGFGIAFELLQIDYAYIPKPNDAFSDSHRISLVLKF